MKSGIDTLIFYTPKITRIGYGFMLTLELMI